MQNNLTHMEIAILKYLNNNIYISYAEAFRLFSPASDYSINHLLELEYLRLLPSNSPDEPDWFILTSKGKAFVEEHLICDSIREQELQRLKKKADSAKHHAIFADILAVLALIVAIAAPFLSAYATVIVDKISQVLSL